MIKYENIYSFEVIDKLKQAVNVRCLDKRSGTVHQLEVLPVIEVFEFINLAEEEPDRFYFYSREETENV